MATPDNRSGLSKVKLEKPEIMNAKRVGIYVRVSKKRTDQTSLASQERQARDFAQSKGWQVAMVFIEDGRSAYKPGAKRPKFDAAMLMAEAKGIDVFLVWKLDRFYRSGSEFNTQWSKLNSYGVEFWSVMESWIDTSTAIGRSQMSALAYQAEIESENRAQRTLAWHDERNQVNESEGQFAAVPGGNRPYGYERQNGNLVVVDDEAAILKEAASRIIAGDPLSRVVRELAPKTTQDAKGGLMSDRGMRRALTNPTTYGLRRTRSGSLVKGCWPAIVDVEKFGLVMAYFDNPTRKHNQTNNKVAHLLAGLLHCAVCEANGETKSRHGKLRSRSNRNKLQCGCGLSVNEANAEAFIIDQLFSTVTQEVWQGWKIKGHGYNVAVAEGIQSKIDKLDMMFLAGKINEDRFDKMNDALQAELAMSLSDEPLDLPDVDDIKASWEDMTIEDQRKIINQAFAKITIHPTRGTGKGYDVADRIKIDVK